MRPVTAIYSGTITNEAGADIGVTMTIEQGTTPIPGALNPSAVTPHIILHGQTVFLAGGFPVTGTIQLRHSTCGVRHAEIQPLDGYVWGTVLQIEFDTDTHYRTGVVLDAFIDPSTGALEINGGKEYAFTQSCLVKLVSGRLARHLQIVRE
jgi:hypothetical protein